MSACTASPVPLLSIAAVFALGLFLLDSTYLPYANERQDALHNQIKGQPPQTYYQPRQQWIFGNESKVYNYKLFDRDHSIFAGLNVFELDPKTFCPAAPYLCKPRSMGGTAAFVDFGIRMGT